MSKGSENSPVSLLLSTLFFKLSPLPLTTIKQEILSFFQSKGVVVAADQVDVTSGLDANMFVTFSVAILPGSAGTRTTRELSSILSNGLLRRELDSVWALQMSSVQCSGVACQDNSVLFPRPPVPSTLVLGQFEQRWPANSIMTAFANLVRFVADGFNLAPVVGAVYFDTVVYFGAPPNPIQPPTPLPVVNAKIYIMNVVRTVSAYAFVTDNTPPGQQLRDFSMRVASIGSAVLCNDQNVGEYKLIETSTGLFNVVFVKDTCTLRSMILSGTTVAQPGTSLPPGPATTAPPQTTTSSTSGSTSSVACVPAGSNGCVSTPCCAGSGCNFEGPSASMGGMCVSNQCLTPPGCCIPLNNGCTIGGSGYNSGCCPPLTCQQSSLCG
eukprot:gb/GEZN01003894.1/.p1 GENE.gb/GEZN01003894.1/~~gb/GEZN01003894.1/.p1  ORF type:complete len:410 (-),score=56.75 gb/GEZN01003894.1/:842-1987(-)